MAKNKIELIEALGTVDTLTVQKSKPLFALWQSELTLAEFKILDTYLGRINSHDDVHRTVKFEKGELEELLGVKQLKPQVLDDRLKHLMTTVCIPDEKSKRGFTRISLFEKAHAEQDEYGVWEAELTCTETAKKYIFNIEEIQYLRYKLKNIINIKSRYTYIMFLYLWENKYRGTWEIDLTELKSMLNCDNEQTYKEFKRFNDLILKKIHKEMHEKTECKYSYEPIKRGRKVVKIKFIYHSYSAEITFDTESFKEPVQLPICDFNSMNELSYYAQALKNSLNIDDLKQILAMLDILHPEYDSGQKYGYLSYLWSKVQHYDNKKSINDKAAYIKSMLENEMKTSKKTEKSQNDDSSNVDKYKQLINKF